MQLQVIWSPKENQGFASKENIIFVRVSVVVTPFMEVSNLFWICV